MKKLIIILMFFAVAIGAQDNLTEYRSVSIDSTGGASTTISTTMDIEGDNLKLIGIAIDTAGWTSANLTIQQYVVHGDTSFWGAVQDFADSVFTITIGAVTEPILVHLPPAPMAGLEKFRFTASAAQDSAITIYTLLRAY